MRTEFPLNKHDENMRWCWMVVFLRYNGPSGPVAISVGYQYNDRARANTGGRGRHHRGQGVQQL